MKIEFTSEEVMEIIRGEIEDKFDIPEGYEVRVESKDYSYRGLSAVVTIEKPIDAAKET